MERQSLLDEKPAWNPWDSGLIVGSLSLTARKLDSAYPREEEIKATPKTSGDAAKKRAGLPVLRGRKEKTGIPQARNADGMARTERKWGA